MSIPLPNLDDRTYAELVAEAQNLLPSLAPAWTNYNAADPGIVLVELLAWLTEMELFRTNEIPPETYQAFLHLLGDSRTPALRGAVLDEAIHETIVALRKPFRAVTREDYERLVMMEFSGRLARVKCLADRRVAKGKLTEAFGHVTLVVMLHSLTVETMDGETLHEIAEFLEERRLLTVHPHVVEPAFVEVRILGSFRVRNDVHPSDALHEAIDRLKIYFDPYVGGKNGGGWPFGRSVSTSEIYAVLAQASSVAYVDVASEEVAEESRARIVETLTLESIAEDSAVQPAIGGSVRLAPHQLVAIDPSRLQAVDQFGLIHSDPQSR